MANAEVIDRKHQSASTRLILTYIFAFISSIIGFLIVIIFSRYMSPDEWGIFSVAKRSATIIATIAILGATDAIARYIPLQRARQSQYADYFGTNATFIVIRSSLAVVILWIGGVYLLSNTTLADSTLVIALFSATMFFLMLLWQEFLSGFLRAEGFIGRFNLMRVLGQLMQLLFGTLVLFSVGANAHTVLLGSAFGIGVVVAISMIILWRLGITVYRKRFVNREVKNEITSYGIPRMAMIILEMLVISLSLILLGFIGKPVEAGLFAISVYFMAILKLSFQPIAFVMLPEFSKLHGMEDSEGMESKIQLLIQAWLYLIAFVVIMVFTFLDIVFAALFKMEYIGAIEYIKILIIGMIPFSFYLTTYSYINAILKRPYVLYILLIAIFVNIVLFFILIPYIGSIGSAVATSFSMIIVGGLMVLLLLKFQPRAFSVINLYDFTVCIFPLAGILISSFVVDNILGLLVITIVFIGIYFYLLKKRKISWFAIIEKRFLHGK